MDPSADVSKLRFGSLDTKEKDQGTLRRASSSDARCVWTWSKVTITKSAGDQLSLAPNCRPHLHAELDCDHEQRIACFRFDARRRAPAESQRIARVDAPVPWP